MGPQAMKKDKRQQSVNNVILYSLACTLFCSSPLWCPPFCAIFNVVFFLSLPKVCLFFFTSKVLFIVGNVIIIFLVRESKFLVSESKASSGQGPKLRSTKRNGTKKSYGEAKHSKTCKVKFFESSGVEEGMLEEEKFEWETLPADELKKLADNFIARFNRQTRLEAQFCNFK